MEELAIVCWILLENDIWWPGIIQNERNTSMKSRTPSYLRIVCLFGTEEKVIADLTKTSEIQLYNANMETNFFELYSHQHVIEELSEKFSLAIEQLNTYAPKVVSIESGNLTIQNSETALIQSPLPSMKRKDALTWDDYFIAVAFLSAMRSKDPSTQVGACIVNSRNRIVGIGYNGFPRGCSDDILPWARSADNELDTKYPYVCHAEVNAIINKNSADLEHCTLYVALFPCNECAKMIIQSGITRVVYLSDKYHNTNSMRASRRMFDLAGVRNDIIPSSPQLSDS